MNRITVIGSCAIDITVIADKRPVAGETILGKGLNMSPGGKGANQAVAAAKLGAEVTMIGCVGNDAYGDMIIDNLKTYGVNTDYMVRREGESSGTAHITLAEGDNSIIVLLGANATLDHSVIDASWEAIASSDLVMVQNETPIDTINYLVERAEAAGVKILLNPAPAANLPAACIEKAAYLTPNEHEFNILCESLSSLEESEIFAKLEGKLLITQGSKGVAYCKEGKLELVPAYSVTNVVDTTGAGDTFNSGFAVALVNGKSMEEAIRYGNAAAALSIQKLGAQGGMPTKEEVEYFLAN